MPATECGDDLQRIHDICKRADGVLIMVDRGDKKVKVFKRELYEVTVLAFSGSSSAKDGSETSVSFFATNCSLL